MAAPGRGQVRPVRNNQEGLEMEERRTAQENVEENQGSKYFAVNLNIFQGVEGRAVAVAV